SSRYFVIQVQRYFV
ncbi:hypothetical protein EC950183_2050, partial [Escherichia coli 95.0183]